MTNRTPPAKMILLLFTLAVALPSMASALTATGQSRFVESAAGNGTLGPVDVRTAPAFDPFDETTESEAFNDFGFGLIRTGIGRSERNRPSDIETATYTAVQQHRRLTTDGVGYCR